MIEVHPSYEFTDEEWHNLPFAERDRITDERARYKRYRTNRSLDNASVISEVTTNSQVGKGLQGQLRSLQHRISTMESQTQSTSIPGSIMGGRNEQANIRSRNNNNNNRSINTMKVVISAQRRRNDIDISQPDAGMESFNELDSNADTCCLGSNFIVIGITDRTVDIYSTILRTRRLGMYRLCQGLLFIQIQGQGTHLF